MLFVDASLAVAIGVAVQWYASVRFVDAPPIFPLALTLCAVACTLAVTLILEHLRAYAFPRAQRHTIRIVLLVIVYSVDTLAALSFPEYAELINLARDTYEAYVLYSFFSLVVELLASIAPQSNLVSACVDAWRARGQATAKNIAPLGLVMGGSEARLDRPATVRYWRFFVVSYVIISPLCTLVTYVTTFEGVFDENSWSFENAHLYVVVVKTISVTFALSALLSMAFAADDALHHYHLHAKLYLVKGLVALVFWQSLAAWQLGSRHLLPASLHSTLLEWHGAEGGDAIIGEDPAEREAAIEAALCNVLLLVELVVFSVLFRFTFGAGQFQAAKIGDKGGFWRNAAHAFSITDVVRDVRMVTDDARSIAEKKRQ